MTSPPGLCVVFPTPGVTALLTSVCTCGLACPWMSHRCSHSACVIFGAFCRRDACVTLQRTCWSPQSQKPDAGSCPAFQGHMRVKLAWAVVGIWGSQVGWQGPEGLHERPVGELGCFRSDSLGAAKWPSVFSVTVRHWWSQMTGWSAESRSAKGVSEDSQREEPWVQSWACGSAGCLWESGWVQGRAQVFWIDNHCDNWHVSGAHPALDIVPT